jgi:hypothetical protein
MGLVLRHVDKKPALPRSLTQIPRQKTGFAAGKHLKSSVFLTVRQYCIQ